MRTSGLTGYAYGLGAAVFVGTVNVVSKHALLTGVSPLALVAAAYAVAALLLAPWAVRFRLSEARDAGPVLGAAITGAVVGPAALFLGLQLTTAVTASLLVNLELFFTAVLATFFLGERVRGREALALLAIAAGGVTVAVGPDLARGMRPDLTNLAGAGLVSIASFSWSLDTTFSTPLTQRYPLRPLLGVKVLVGAVGLGAAAMLTGGFGTLGPDVAPHILYNATIGTLGSVLLLLAGFRAVGATRTIVLFATAGFWGALTSWSLLGEALTWPHLVGGLLMLGGVVALSRTAAGRAEPPPRYLGP